MPNWITALLGAWKAFFSWLGDKQLLDAGGARAELKGRKEADEIASNIDDARNDDELRDSTRDKYTRD